MPQKSWTLGHLDRPDKSNDQISYLDSTLTYFWHNFQTSLTQLSCNNYIDFHFRRFSVFAWRIVFIEAARICWKKLSFLSRSSRKAIIWCHNALTRSASAAGKMYHHTIVSTLDSRPPCILLYCSHPIFLSFCISYFAWIQHTMYSLVETGQHVF